MTFYCYFPFKKRGRFFCPNKEITKAKSSNFKLLLKKYKCSPLMSVICKKLVAFAFIVSVENILSTFLVWQMTKSLDLHLE